MSDFQKEVAERITAMAADKELRDSAASFMRASTMPKYSYNFSWQGRPIIQYLVQLATRPEFHCRVRWEPRTLTMWDNPCVMHTAINDYSGYRRVTYRTTIEGWVPQAAPPLAAPAARARAIEGVAA